jgi:uncharacterized protein (TIRG00374 family)
MKIIRYFSVIGFILLFLILRTIDFQELFAILADIKVSLVVATFIVVLVEIYLKVYRWRLLVTLIDRRYTMTDSFYTYMIGIGLGGVTPAKSGDLIKSVDLQRRSKVPLKDALSLSIFDKVADFLILLLFSVVSVLVTITVFQRFGYLLLPIIAIILLIMVTFMFILKKNLIWVLRAVHRTLIPGRFRIKVRSLFYSLRRTTSMILSSSRFISYLAATVVSWVLLFLMPWLLALSINLDISVWYVLLFSPLVHVVENLPISVMGIGSRDIAVITLYALIGMTREQMFAVSLLVFLITGLPRIVVGLTIALAQKKSETQSS